jgi:uncharacterized protein YjbI with pentapeptide repeats
MYKLLRQVRWSDLLRKRGAISQDSGDDATAATRFNDPALPSGTTTPSRRLPKMVGLRAPVRESGTFTKGKLIDYYASILKASKRNAKSVSFDVSNFSFNHKASDDASRVPILNAVRKASGRTGMSEPSLSGKFSSCTFNGVSFAELSLENSEFLNGSITNCLFGWISALGRGFALGRDSRAVVRSCKFDCAIINSDFVNIDVVDSQFEGELHGVRFNEGDPAAIGRIDHSKVGQGTKFRRIKASKFTHVCFSGIEFRSDLVEVHFIDCDFQASQDQSRIQWPRTLREVEFQVCTFHGVDFSICDFVDCTFAGCTFVECRFSQTKFRGRTRLDRSQFRMCEFVQTTFRGDVCGLSEASEGERDEGSRVRLRALELERCQLDGAVFSGVIFETPLRFQQCETQNLQITEVSIERRIGDIVFDQGSVRGMKYSGLVAEETEGTCSRIFCLLGCCFDNVVLSSIPYSAIGLPKEKTDAESYFCRDERRADEVGSRQRDEKRRLLDRAAKFYGQLYRICLEESSPAAAGEFFFRMMVAKTKTSSGWRKLGYQVANILCGYGERIWRVVSLSIAVVLLWACGFLVNGLWIDDQVFYYGLVPRAEVEATYRGEGEEGVVLGDFDLSRFSEDFTDTIRLSANVFTSMGDETIRQPNRFGSLLVAIESFLGVFVTALFVSVFFRKIAR